ncbi:MAG: hypothetical protein IK076_01415, partial [Bacteroidales bacterium]|nr:hypothetical protein [Bacteroidales bacterium]
SIRFRVLFLPQLHVQEGVTEATAELLSSYPGFGADIIPYHLLGNAKREKLGLPEIRFREPSKDEILAFESAVLGPSRSAGSAG